MKRRREIAEIYNGLLSDISEITPLKVAKDVLHAYHLYVVRIDFPRSGTDKDDFFSTLKEKGIGVNVHYIPVHFHPFYRRRFNTGPKLCPVAEKAYEQIISLPIYPAMTDGDVETVVKVLKDII